MICQEFVNQLKLMRQQKEAIERELKSTNDQNDALINHNMSLCEDIKTIKLFINKF